MLKTFERKQPYARVTFGEAASGGKKQRMLRTSVSGILQSGERTGGYG